MTLARTIVALLAAGTFATGALCACSGAEAQGGRADASALHLDASTDASSESFGDGLAPLDGPFEQPDAVADAGTLGDGSCPNVWSHFDGGCGDLQTDPRNCGTCGTDCEGGACEAGACVPLPANTLATGQLAPIAIAADGQNVYWLNWGTSKNVTGGVPPPPVTFGGEVLECAAAGCGNHPTVLAEVPTTQGYLSGTGGGTPTAPSALAVDTTNVYWTTQNSVLACAIGGCGCSPTTIRGSLIQPPGVTAAAGRVFWSTWVNGAPYTGRVETCASTGCTSAPLTLAGGQGGPLGLTADGTNVYWADTYGPDGGGAIEGCAAGGCNGAPTVMWGGVTTEGNPRNITNDATNLYWTDGTGGVMQCAKSDCAATRITLVAGHGNLDVGAIAVDATDVYWREGNVYKCAIGGCNGTPTLVATASASRFQWDGALAVDATRVYWVETGSTQDDDRIMWAAK